MLVACICNPIFINTFVVFVRLYWFEKRFQSVVLEASRLRRTRERSRSRTEARDEEHTIGSAEHTGVGDKKITVMRPGNRDDEARDDDERPADTASETESSERKAEMSNDVEKDDTLAALSPNTPHLPRAITFADQAPTPTRPRNDTDASRLPVPRSKEDSIAFVQQQRHNPEDDTLYIPGPRDFDRGAVPKNISSPDEQGGLHRARTTESFPSIRADGRTESHGDDPLTNAPERSKTSTSDSDAVANATRNRLVDRVKDHLPFHHHSEDADAEGTGRKRRDSLASEGLRRRDRTRTFASFMTTSKTENKDPMPYLSYQPTIGRNSAFVNLTEEQREELGGIEYRALKLLATVLCTYYIGFHVLGMLSFLPWIKNASAYYKDTLNSDGVDQGWWGVFTAASMFNDLGFTLTPDSMISFKGAVWILLMGSFLIIIGNTGFPCMLRFVIWVVTKCVPKRWPLWEELQFLLDHPRRCFTLLFPSKATWWLFWVLILLNAMDLVFFVVLDLHDTPVQGLPGGIKFVDGLFQAASTRTAGFAVVSLSDLHPAIQVSYLIMMYISVFPIAISIRRTNVYEEKSLGVYAQATDADDEETSNTSYVGAHLRRQLSFDLWYVFLGLFIIAIVEGDRIQNTNEYAFTVFSVLFEVVSAYGTVGLSLGYPNYDPSFSGQFRVLSKLVIIAMQIRGRHRGLPYALDKAVLLPSESLQQKEAEEANMREAARRRGSVAGGLPAAGTIGRSGTLGRSATMEKSATGEKSARGPDAIDEAHAGLEPRRSATGGRSVSEGTTRGKGISFGRLLTNAIGVGPTLRGNKAD